MRNVVNTQNVANVILEKLNNESKLVLINKVVEAAQTQFTNLSAELKTSVSKLQKKLDEVEQKASVLEKFELGQVEEAINETLKKMASEGLFETLCLDINGQRYKLGSLIQKLATADRVVNFLYGWDSGYSELKSITAVLDDGTNVVLNGSYEDVKDDKGNITGRVYKFATDNWKGLKASFEVEFKRVSDTYSVLGQNIESEEWVPVRSTNIVFDITPDTCTPATADSTTPDLNQDGQIGNNNQ